MEASEQLFGPVRGEFEKNSPKIRTPGGLKLRFDWLAQLVERQSAVREVEDSSPRPDEHSGSSNN